ncbi:MAG: HEAT repeat domain-containing protein [Calditrichaeota bacterium]|nr:HEAT repeat domain-containing protein [Calditrichota bacterium]
MTPRFTKQELEDFVEILSTDDPAAAEYAISSLLLASPRQKYSLLVKALPQSDDLRTQRICFILSSIPDNRCIDPLLGVLQRKNPVTQIAAIDALKYYPKLKVLPHLTRQLFSKDKEVREKVIEALGEFIKYGISEARDPLLKIVHDKNEVIELRRAAIKALSNLEDEDLLPILENLQNSSRAELFAEAMYEFDMLDTKDKDKEHSRVNQLVSELRIEKDVVMKMFLTDKIVESGRLGAKVIMEQLLKFPQNFELLTYGQQVFEELGLKSVPVLEKVFGTFDQFDDMARVHMLSNLVWVAKEAEMDALAPALTGYFFRMLAYLDKHPENPNVYFLYKAELLLALARFGVTDILDDLKKTFDDGSNLGLLYLIESVFRIGDRDFLLPLVNLYEMALDSRRDQSKVKKAFRAIIKREKIKRDDPLFKDLPPDNKKSLDSLFNIKQNRKVANDPPF